jgi:GTP-binding protein
MTSEGTRIAEAEFVAGAARADQVPASFEDVPEIAFAGRSNVGKSSLLNMMLARRGLARTSNTPGCTRQINFFAITLANAEPKRLVFVDLPGYGYAKVSKSESAAWKQLLEGYLLDRPTLRAVVILVDVRRGLEKEEEDLLGFLAQRPGLTVIVAATKLDKLPRSQQKPALAKLAKKLPQMRKFAEQGLGEAEVSAGNGIRIVGTSAETRDGRDALWSQLLAAARAT